MQEQKFLTIDIGYAWTKVFLARLDKNSNLSIEKVVKLPTSKPNFSLAVETLLAKIEEKPSNKLLVSKIPEVEKWAKEKKIEFVSLDEANEALADYFKKSGSQVVILDGGASNFSSSVDAKEIGKYLTFRVSEVEIENFIGNKLRRGHFIPKDTKELEFEEALTRVAFANKFAESEKNNFLVVATGGLLSATPAIARLGLIILDLLHENQVATGFFDREFFLPSFGALLAVNKELKVANTDQWFENLGGFVSLGGAKDLKLDWGYSQIQEVSLTPDEIAIIPAAKDQQIKVTVSLGKEKQEFTLQGGLFGILLDARAKPLQLYFGQEASRAKVSGWIKEVEKTQMLEEVF